MPTDYQKTKIYKIESHLGDKIYVGSTAKEYLSQRFQQHKNDYKRWKNGKGNNITSFVLFDEYGIENCQIVLIEAYPCNSKDEKNAKEGHYIKTLNCVNKVVVGRTREETQKAYHQSDKGKIAVKKAQGKFETTDARKAYQKEYQKEYQAKKKALIQAYIERDLQLTENEQQNASIIEQEIRTINEC